MEVMQHWFGKNNIECVLFSVNLPLCIYSSVSLLISGCCNIMDIMFISNCHFLVWSLQSNYQNKEIHCTIYVCQVPLLLECLNSHSLKIKTLSSKNLREKRKRDVHKHPNVFPCFGDCVASKCYTHYIKDVSLKKYWM